MNIYIILLVAFDNILSLFPASFQKSIFVLKYFTYLQVIIVAFYLIYSLFKKRTIFMSRNVIWVLFLDVFLLISFFVNLNFGSSGRFLVNLILDITLFTLFSINDSDAVVNKNCLIVLRFYQFFYFIYMLIATIMSFIVIFYGSFNFLGDSFYFKDSRLFLGDNPNTLAIEAVFLCIVTALLWIISEKKRDMILSLISLVFTIFILGCTQSRTSFYCFLGFLCLFFIVYFTKNHKKYGFIKKTLSFIAFTAFLIVVYNAVLFTSTAVIFVNQDSETTILSSENSNQDVLPQENLNKTKEIVRLDDSIDRSFTGRDRIWKESIKYISANPLFGVSDKKIAERDSLLNDSNHTHNQYLQIALYAGLPAAITFLFMLLYACFLGAILLFKYKDIISGACLVYICTFSVWFMFESSFHTTFFSCYLLSIGLIFFRSKKIFNS